MHMMKTFSVTALLIGVTGIAQAQYGSGNSAASAGAGMADMAMGAPAMTGKLGDQVFLMDGHKMTLYTFDNDGAGTSSCYDTCAQKWPPLLAPAGTKLSKGYGLTQRTDGTMQVTYKNQPLYLWAQDMQPGQMSGDGVGGVWHIARP